MNDLDTIIRAILFENEESANEHLTSTDYSIKVLDDIGTTEIYKDNKRMATFILK